MCATGKFPGETIKMSMETADRFWRKQKTECLFGSCMVYAAVRLSEDDENSY